MGASLSTRAPAVMDACVSCVGDVRGHGDGVLTGITVPVPDSTAGASLFEDLDVISLLAKTEVLVSLGVFP